jgi:hypothetical protein
VTRRQPDPPVFLEERFFSDAGEFFDKLRTYTKLSRDFTRYLASDRNAELQAKADELIKAALKGDDVRKLLHKKKGRNRRPIRRRMAIAVEHARLVKNGQKAEAATKLIVKAFISKGEKGSDEALSREIRRAVQTQGSIAAHLVDNYELVLQAANLIT